MEYITSPLGTFVICGFVWIVTEVDLDFRVRRAKEFDAKTDADTDKVVESERQYVHTKHPSDYPNAVSLLSCAKTLNAIFTLLFIQFALQ